MRLQCGVHPAHDMLCGTLIQLKAVAHATSPPNRSAQPCASLTLWHSSNTRQPSQVGPPSQSMTCTRGEARGAWRGAWRGSRWME